MNKKILTVISFIFILMIFTLQEAFAQCPMCRAAVETATEGGSSVGLGLNAGILYLLVMPYLMFSVIFYFWYRNYKKHKALQGG